MGPLYALAEEFVVAADAFIGISLRTESELEGVLRMCDR
jgi:hypothetical protein